MALGQLTVGIGHDTHRVAAGGPLRLGGVTIDHDRHLVGHSDGDVLLHAVIDAILGAAGLGDIGDMFPDDDPANAGRDSAELLQLAYRAARSRGFRLINVDSIVFAQRPKLGPLKESMRQRLAQLLDIDSDAVSVKAKTGEGVDAVGLEQAMAAQCIVLLARDGDASGDAIR